MENKEELTTAELTTLELKEKGITRENTDDYDKVYSSIYCKYRYQKNKEKMIQTSKEHYKNNAEHYREYKKEYYENNKEKAYTYVKKYKDKNKSYWLEKQSGYRQNRINKMREQGITNPWSVLKGGKPKYKDNIEKEHI